MRTPSAPGAEASPHQTDLGNARRFVRQHQAGARHVAAWHRWLIWDGRRWQHDTTGAAMRLAAATVRALHAEATAASAAPAAPAAGALAAWALRSEASERLSAMLRLAQSQPELAREPAAFDQHPWLLNVANGTLDLRTGVLGPHEPTQQLTRIAPVAYDALAPCPTWLAFLERVLAGNERLMAYLRRAIGYSLTGATSEQVLFVLHGPGANGKSTLLETLAGLLGDYALSLPSAALLARRENAIPNDIARLAGARFVRAVETEQGQALAEALVKQLTGGDTISARFMRGEWFDFTPICKLWLAVNHLPVINGTDDGIWRRIHTVPFRVRIPEAERDRDLGERLRAEYPGILAWAVRGCLEWRESGLNLPAELRAATASYRAAMDHFGRFLGETCVLAAEARVSAAALRQAYEAWCAANGERPRSQTWLGRELHQLALTRERNVVGLTVYQGLGLASAEG